MRERLIVLCFSCLIFAAPALAQAQERDFEPLFDGESLAGWEGNEALFRVLDNAIVGGRREEPIESDEFLCTTEEFEDFELQLDAKMTDGQIAGVQFRAQRRPEDAHVGGYQADMGYLPGEAISMLSDIKDIEPDRPYPLWGSLLDEYRQDTSRYPDSGMPYWLLAVADRELVESVVKPGGWNHVAVKAIGPRIQIWLNGVKTVDYAEPEPVPRSGLICLQAHSGPPSEAFYRNILIRRIGR